MRWLRIESERQSKSGESPWGLSDIQAKRFHDYVSRLLFHAFGDGVYF
jgi:hypothetical protein